MTGKIFTAAILTIALICDQCDGEEEVSLVTRRTPYSLSATWTIEHYLELPYQESGITVQSARFPSGRKNGIVPWFFRIRPAKMISYSLRPDKLVIPSNVFQIYASSECSIIDVHGKKSYTVVGERKSVILDYRNGPSGWEFDLVNQEELMNQSSTMLPEGHLTVRCEIDGFLFCNETTKTDVIKEMENISRFRCDPIISEKDSMFVTLLEESSVKDFNCKKRVLVLFENVLRSVNEVEGEECLGQVCDIILKYRNTCN